MSDNNKSKYIDLSADDDDDDALEQTQRFDDIDDNEGITTMMDDEGNKTIWFNHWENGKLVMELIATYDAHKPK